jgi:GxxExxY protein
MHPKFSRADILSGEPIGSAIEVHRKMGAGLMESVYLKCLCRELQLRSISFCSEVTVPITYKDITFQEKLKVDLYVEDCLVVELKAVECIVPNHKAQLLSYMKLLDAPLGLLINFHEALLKRGISRCILPGANAPEE